MLVLLLVVGVLGGEPQQENKHIDLVMPGARPSMEDDYLCSSFLVEAMTGSRDTVHITGFEPHALANKAHHMLLYSCDEPNEEPGKVYDCLHHSMCRGGQSIIFAWAKNAPATTLPKGVSAAIVPNERRYLVLQVHYSHPLSEPDHTGLSLKYQTEPTKYTSGILLMMRGSLTIPPNTPVVHGDVNCRVPSNVPLNLFAYRTHAHALSPVITGYVYTEEGHKYREIARGSPQWPQAFYPMKKVETVTPDDILAARCTYNSTGVDHTTHIGSTSGDEMCNLYIMYFTEPGKVGDYLICGNEQEGSDISRGLPADSDKPPLKRPEMEEHAKDIHKQGGDDDINYAQLFDDELLRTTSKKKAGMEEGAHLTAWFNMTMPGAKPNIDDDYICTGVKVSDIEPEHSLWAVEFSPVLEHEVHHMILSRCKRPRRLKEGEMWDCRHHATCDGESKIMFAWAKHAPPTKLPPDVGFALEKDDYLVLQVHYAKPVPLDHSGISLRVVTSAPTYTAGMLLLVKSNLNIPPDTEKVHADVNCMAPIRSPAHLFAYRTHAHSLGSVISGYRFTPSDRTVNGGWSLVAKGNPMWPQAFYPMEETMTVNPGEILAARCTYNTIGHHTQTKIGATGGDEMCNLYLMFYTKSPEDDFLVCADEQAGDLSRQLPAGNDVPLPSNPALESEARGDPREGKSLPGSDLSADISWPTTDTAKSLGQLSGVSLDIYGNVVIFHRGDRRWNGLTFKNDNTYGESRDVPIPNPTVLTVNSSGHTVNSWGAGKFFLPHMITVDSKNNIWLTDVALHQVFKFGPYGGEGDKKEKPLIVLGERFVPGSDDKHYCKPTAVAVTEDTNTFFVSDGYCNSRVIKYQVTVDAVSGVHTVQKVLEWGKGAGPFTIQASPYSFNIPHGLALMEDKDQVCVADRENGRVQCFDLGGKFVRSIQPKEFGSRIFSVAYTKANGGQLHAVSGPEFSLNPLAWSKKPTGFIVSADSGELEGTWNVPGGLSNPHDIVVSKDGGQVYVVELDPFKVWKLTNGAPSAAVPTPNLPPTLSSSQLKKPEEASSKSSISSVSASLNSMAAKVMPGADANSSAMIAAAISVPLSLLVAICLCIRRCRKRGRGSLVGGAGSGKKNFKDWSVGDVLGRNKDGFSPLNTEDRDVLLEDDSESEVEEFSVPANHA